MADKLWDFPKPRQEPKLNWRPARPAELRADAALLALGSGFRGRILTDA